MLDDSKEMPFVKDVLVCILELIPCHTGKELTHNASVPHITSVARSCTCHLSRKEVGEKGRGIDSIGLSRLAQKRRY